MADFVTLDLPTLISSKILVTEKMCNFHTVGDVQTFFFSWDDLLLPDRAYYALLQFPDNRQTFLLVVLFSRCKNIKIRGLNMKYRGSSSIMGDTHSKPIFNIWKYRTHITIYLPILLLLLTPPKIVPLPHRGKLCQRIHVTFLIHIQILPKLHKILPLGKVSNIHLHIILL